MLRFKYKQSLRRVGREYFVYYLKEFEFRYNFSANLDGMLYNVLARIKGGITLFYNKSGEKLPP
jgi:hypothetical protein